MTDIHTVTGATTPEDLGVTLMHEHLMIGYPGWEADSIRPGPTREEMFSRCVDRVEEMKAHGVTAMLDPAFYVMIDGRRISRDDFVSQILRKGPRHRLTRFEHETSDLSAAGPRGDPLEELTRAHRTRPGVTDLVWTPDGSALVIGAYLADPSGVEEAGASYLFRATDTGGITDLDTADYAVLGEEPSGSFGYGLSGGGDVNDDGIPDVALGGWSIDGGGVFDAGTVAIFFGSSTRTGTNLTGAADVLIHGQSPEDHLGWSVDISGDVKKVALDIKAGMLDVDAYLPPPSADAATSDDSAASSEQAVVGAPATESPPAAEQDPVIELPLEMLRTLDLQGELSMASVTVNAVPVTDILMKTQAKAGVVRINPLQLKALDGNASASVIMNVKSDMPDYAVGLKASDMHPGPVVNPLLVGVFGEQEVTLDGVANVVADIKTRGDRVSQLKQAAKGNLRFDMGKTILQGVDFEYFVRGVVADYLAGKSIKVPADWRGSFNPQTKTAFHRVHASAVVANGDITNKDLILDSSRIKVKGEGVVNIVRNDMDYNALVDIEPAHRKTTAEKLLDQPLAVRIHGPFEQLAYDVDKNQLKKVLGDLLEAEARAKVKKELEEEKEKLRQKAKEEEQELKQKLEDKLKDKLKGLF